MIVLDDDIVNDLKQFIQAALDQQTVTLRQEIRDEFRPEFERIHQRIDGASADLKSDANDLSAAVTEALDATHQTYDAWLKDHEKRLLQLEHPAHT